MRNANSPNLYLRNWELKVRATFFNSLHWTRSRSAVLINAIGDAPITIGFVLRTGDPLIWRLHETLLREHRSALHTSANMCDGVHDVVHVVLLRVEIRCIRYSVICPILLIERLNLKHLLERQVTSRLDNILRTFQPVTLDHLSHERILRRNTHNHSVLSVRIGLYVVAFVHHLKALVGLRSVQSRETHTANEVLREYWVGSLRDAGKLGDRACRSDSRRLHGHRDTQIMSERRCSAIDNLSHRRQHILHTAHIRSIRVPN